MLEQDFDMYEWAQSFFETCPLYDTRYMTNAIDQDSNSIRHINYPGNQYGTEFSHVENDEIIAHTLQEEFSQLAMREMTENYHAPEQGSSISVDHHEWQSLPMRHYYSGHNYDNGEIGSIRGINSPSTYGEAYSYSQNPNNENVYGEFSNPLDQLNPVSHIPRINGEIPSVDEASSDYERLRQRLQLYDLAERHVQGDGNCQFSALSDQLYQTPDNHESVRQEIVCQLRTNSKFYEGYVTMDYDEYLNKMMRNGEWGDHVTLQAAADVYGARILVITSFKDTCYIEILPNDKKTKRVLLLSFWAEVHYNSIYSQGDADIPSSNPGKKKRWWPFWG